MVQIRTVDSDRDIHRPGRGWMRFPSSPRLLRKKTTINDIGDDQDEERCYSIEGKTPDGQICFVKTGNGTYTVTFFRDVDTGPTPLLGIKIAGAMPGMYHAAANQLRFIEASTYVQDSLLSVTPAPEMMVPASVWSNCLRLEIPICVPRGQASETVEDTHDGFVPVDTSTFVEMLTRHLRTTADAITAASKHTPWAGRKLAALVHGSPDAFVAMIGFEIGKEEVAKARADDEDGGNKAVQQMKHYRLEKRRHFIETSGAIRAFHAVMHIARRVIQDPNNPRGLQLGMSASVDPSVASAMGLGDSEPAAESVLYPRSMHTLTSGHLLKTLEQAVVLSLDRAAMVSVLRDNYRNDIEKRTRVSSNVDCFCNTCGTIGRLREMRRCATCRQSTYCDKCCGPPPGHAELCEAGFWGIRSMF